MMMMEMFFPSLSKWAHTVYHFNSWEHLHCGLVGMGELIFFVCRVHVMFILITRPTHSFIYYSPAYSDSTLDPLSSSTLLNWVMSPHSLQ